MNGKEKVSCTEFENLLSLHACEELEGDSRAELEAHLAGCPACAAALVRERKLLAALAECEAPAPSSALLAQCRSELAEALEAIPEKRTVWTRLYEALRPSSWLALHPAWSAAFLVLIGVVLGQFLPPQSRDSGQTSAPPAMTVSALSDYALRDVNISGINWVSEQGREMPSVELSMMAETPVVMRGTVDNTDVRRVLMFVVENNQRFDSGVRLDSVELLRTRGDDAEVRRALCYAARNDRNPGVRLKSIEALRGFEQDEQVRRALLDALLGDGNPGVRIEAINALRALVERQPVGVDDELRKVLEDRMQRDPNTYIRMQSAAAVRQINSREPF